MSRNVMVIGASSGVGYALVELLSQQDITILALSRRGTTYSGEAKASIINKAVDITVYSLLEAVVSDAVNTNVLPDGLDVIVNCVGVGFYAPLESDFSEYWLKIFNTNTVGLMNIISNILRFSVHSSQFINIGSIAAYRPSKTVGNIAYSASKAACIPIMEEFRRLLRADGNFMRVTNIAPGFVADTDFSKNYFSSSPENTIDLYSAFKPLSPKDVAASVLNIINIDPSWDVSEMVLRPVEQPD